MEVKKLVCDVCGGQIEMQSGGKGVCTSCGTPYSAEIIKYKIQEIRGTIKIDGPVEIVKGGAEKERLMNNVETYFKLSDPYSAIGELDKYINLFPDDIKPYILKLNFFVSLDDSIHYPRTLFEIEDLYEIICTLDICKEYVPEIEKKIEIYALDILSGKKRFAFGAHDWLMYDRRMELMKNNYLKDILITGKDNARKINTLVYEGYKRELDPTSEKALGVSPDTPCVFALLGYVCTPYGHDYDLICERVFKKGDLNKQIQDMYADRQRRHVCRHCGWEFKGILKKECSHCSRPKDY